LSWGRHAGLLGHRELELPRVDDELVVPKDGEALPFLEELAEPPAHAAGGRVEEGEAGDASVVARRLWPLELERVADLGELVGLRPLRADAGARAAGRHREAGVAGPRRRDLAAALTAHVGHDVEGRDPEHGGRRRHPRVAKDVGTDRLAEGEREAAHGVSLPFGGWPGQCLMWSSRWRVRRRACS